MLALTGGYWAPNANSILLLHVWSLAVEEQFYLLLPIILAVSHRWLRRRTELVLMTLFAASLFLSFYWGETGYAGNFYLLPPRAWELLLGCLGAWAVHHRFSVPKALQPTATAIGLGGILLSTFILHDSPQWPNSWTLLPTIAALLILISPANQGKLSPPVRLLSLPPLRFIGLISYSLYLWHWPILVFLKGYRGGELALTDRWSAAAVSVVFAALSWRFIEQPFRNKLRRLRVPTKPLLTVVGAVWVCLLTVSQEMAKKPPQHTGAPLRPAFFNSPGRESIAEYDARSRLADGGIQFNASGREPRCVVLGSSHGMMLGPVIHSLSDLYNIPCALFCESGITPLFVPAGTDSHAPRRIRELRERDELVKKYLSQWKPDVVILAAKWDSEMQDWGKNLGPAWPSFPEALSNTVRWLSEHSSHVLLLGQIPELPFYEGEDAANTIWQRYRNGMNRMPQLLEPAEVTAERHQALALFQNSTYTNVIILDPTLLLQNADHTLRYYNSRGILYFDYNHLNSLGSMELKPLFEPYFKNMAH
jgi:hypothetical protein